VDLLSIISSARSTGVSHRLNSGEKTHPMAPVQILNQVRERLTQSQDAISKFGWCQGSLSHNRQWNAK